MGGGGPPVGSEAEDSRGRGLHRKEEVGLAALFPSSHEIS